LLEQLPIEVADPDMMDLARSHGFVERVDPLGERHAIVRPMQQETAPYSDGIYRRIRYGVGGFILPSLTNRPDGQISKPVKPRS
jgi:hypothetical protein